MSYKNHVCSTFANITYSLKMILKSFLVLVHVFSLAYALLSSYKAVSNCGVAKATANGDRIVGGRDAIDGEFPWQVSLRFRLPFIPSVHICGGTILNDKWIITAAHCIDGRKARNFEVAVGVYKQNEKGKYFASYLVEKMIAHKDFNRETFSNDIALLKIKGSILLDRSNGFINGICLPEQNPVTGFVTTTGWGATTEGGDVADTLQAVELPVVPMQICNDLFQPDYNVSTMLCAGEPEGGKDSCQGDSGGPLVQTGKDGRSRLVGIVSWGIGCARPGYPGVYTNVSCYNSWINSYTT